MAASWLEHLRQHERVTNADRVIQDTIREFGAATEPKVTHFIAARLQSTYQSSGDAFAGVQRGRRGG
jgi:hypothetical protein